MRPNTYDPYLDPHASIYPPPPGRPRVFGLFENQIIMGYKCSIKCEQVPDGDARCVDMLGMAGAFRVGGLAIHISGLNSYGYPVDARHIDAIGIYEIVWPGDGKKPHEPNSSFSGFGCDGPEPAVILGGEMKHAMWSACDYFATLEGIYRWGREKGDFTPKDICTEIDKLSRRNTWDRLAESPQHTRAVRRLLEAAVGLSNHNIPSVSGKIGCTMIERVGRWAYRWHDAS